LERFL
jgi:hypothetical protein